jgi:hypothetical protein
VKEMRNMRKMIAIALVAAVFLGGSFAVVSTGPVNASPPNGGMNDPPEGRG